MKVLIPTSWKWVALGEITNYINKALIKVGRKPAISYIIDAYPADTEFVVTTGYFGEQVRNFLELVYPEKSIRYVEVDTYEGPGSGLAHTMSCAREHLQEPFVYHACDTIVLDLPAMDTGTNWVAWYAWDGSANYAGMNVTGKSVDRMFEKWMLDPDLIHVGLVGIRDYGAFWQGIEALLEKTTDPSERNDIPVLNAMLALGLPFEAKKVEQWFDTGNIDGLNRARKEIPDSFHILDKLEESIYIYDSFVVKYFANPKLAEKRVKRAEFLQGFTPKIQWSKKNFFRYEFAEGKLYSRTANPKNFAEFFEWSKKNLWKDSHEVDDETFRKVCHDFYYVKSKERIDAFLKNHGLVDEEHVINGERIPAIRDIFEKIDFDWLCTSKQTLFHGDFILDNILQTEDDFCLLDWRQDFGGLLQSGDMYYDIAKLNHNLTVNHDIVNANLLTVEKGTDWFFVDIHRKELLVQCQATLHELIVQSGLDLKKVEVLTAIIWLNMSPLHHHPFDKFLYYFWKYNLWKALNR